LRFRHSLIAGAALLALAIAPVALADSSPGGGAGGSTTGTGTTGTGTTGTGAGTTGTTGTTGPTGGAGMGGPSPSPSTPAHPTVPGDAAKIVNGLAYAPADAPVQVQKAIWAGDAIRHKPYVYGGGHGNWKDAGYDCSGSVSYILHAAGLIKTSMDSGDFETWGVRGLGHWITVYTNPGHAFVQIAGIRLDTSAEQDPHPPAGSGPRWRPLMKRTSGFQPRHPASF
jgi:hypothetical protein